MTKPIHTALWLITVGALLLGAVFFRFALRGYSYIAHILTFIAALIVLRRFAPERLWQVTAVIVSIGLFYFCAVEALVIANSRTDSDAGRKYLVVLGAQVTGTRPSPSLYYRLLGAQEYLFLNPDSKVVVSGGQGEGEEITEAQCMRDWLISAGIAPERILMEEEATSTMENLAFSFDLIRAQGDEPDGNVTVLSSSYHLCRAKQMARLLGVDAAGYAAYPGNPVLALNFFVREAFGMTHLWVFGS